MNYYHFEQKETKGAKEEFYEEDISNDTIIWRIGRTSAMYDAHTKKMMDEKMQECGDEEIDEYDESFSCHGGDLGIEMIHYDQKIIIDGIMKPQFCDHKVGAQYQLVHEFCDDSVWLYKAQALSKIEIEAFQYFNEKDERLSFEDPYRWAMHFTVQTHDISSSLSNGSHGEHVHYKETGSDKRPGYAWGGRYATDDLDHIYPLYCLLHSTGCGTTGVKLVKELDYDEQLLGKDHPHKRSLLSMINGGMMELRQEIDGETLVYRSMRVDYYDIWTRKIRIVFLLSDEET